MPIRWQLQNDLIVIPKSTTPSRIRENMDVFDFELTGDELDAAAELPTDEGVGRHPDESRPAQ